MIDFEKFKKFMKVFLENMNLNYALKIRMIHI